MQKLYYNLNIYMNSVYKGIYSDLLYHIFLLATQIRQCFRIELAVV